MKKILQIAAVTGMILPLFAQGQVTVTQPSTANSLVFGGTTFSSLVADMYTDVTDLYLHLPYNTAVFDTTNKNWETSGTGGSVADPVNSIFFKEMTPNANFFLINNYAQAGYLGNHSVDTNQLNLLAYDGSTPGLDLGDSSTWNAALSESETLFDYDSSGIAPTVGPPDTRGITVDGGGVALISLEHTDYSWPLPAGSTTSTAGDANKFKIFWAYDYQGNALNAALFAIDDRTSDSVDYNDGLFYVEGITPVPEPAHIAGLAILGLGGILLVRRRFKSKK